jgi:hypothetical protein
MSDEAYLNAPGIVHEPGAEYAADTRAFQGIPALEIAPSGRLWAAWYGGGTGEDRHNYVLLATADGNGGSWQPPSLIIDPDGDGPVRAYDPCLWHDPAGRLWLFWAQGYEGHTDERAGVWAMTAAQSDAAAPAWSPPRRLCDGIMMNKPTVLSSGEWLLPVARWRREGSAQVYLSRDDGASFTFHGSATVPVASERNCDEHMIVELVDGRLWMLVRTSYGIGESLRRSRTPPRGFSFGACAPERCSWSNTAALIAAPVARTLRGSCLAMTAPPGGAGSCWTSERAFPIPMVSRPQTAPSSSSTISIDGEPKRSSWPDSRKRMSSPAPARPKPQRSGSW